MIKQTYRLLRIPYLQSSSFARNIKKTLKIPSSPSQEITQDFINKQSEASQQISSSIQNISQQDSKIQLKETLPPLTKDEDKERLTKKMSRLGICSRRQGEKMIQKGIVYLNGQKVIQNMLITDTDEIQIKTHNTNKLPIKDSQRLWLYNKPQGLISTHNDPQQRPTIFELLKGKLELDHVISVGRLDYNSEGLMLITNDGELSRVLELPQNALKRTYEVRVFGKLDLEKLNKIRQGAIINGQLYGPFEADIIRRQTRNTWMRISMRQGKNREIRRVMQKHSLRVNRLRRIEYGPYKLSKLPSNEVVEVEITKDLKKLIFQEKKIKLQGAQQKERDEKEAKQILDSSSDIRFNLIEEKKKRISSSQNKFVFKKYV